MVWYILDILWQRRYLSRISFSQYLPHKFNYFAREKSMLIWMKSWIWLHIWIPLENIYIFKNEDTLFQIIMQKLWILKELGQRWCMKQEIHHGKWQIQIHHNIFLLAKATNSFLDNCECHLVSYFTFCWLTLLSWWFILELNWALLGVIWVL